MPTKPIDVEWGSDSLHLAVPKHADVLALSPWPKIAAPEEAIRRALEQPIGTPPLASVIRAKQAGRSRIRAAVVVSDNTRPVPYRGPEGILDPVLKLLRAAGGVQIEIIVANGTHRPLSDAELHTMLCESAFAPDVTITNHVCTELSSLRPIGHTKRGTEVSINSCYLDADLKILTGLVEPHFVAGVSGGRKAICPGLIGQKATYGFHSAAMIAHPKATSLVLDGNPCHEESLAVAQMAGADFIVNATINRHRQLTGVFAGDLFAAHEAAARKVIEMNRIPIRHPYDMVVTHGGFVAINHYQAGKAAVEAAHAIRQDGTLILAANHTDINPVGRENYRAMIKSMREMGVEEFLRRVLLPEWTFIPEQWQAQIWGYAMRKVGSHERLVYAAPQLTGALFRESGVPGTDAGFGVEHLKGREWAQAAVQRAVDRHMEQHPGDTVAVLVDGPYGTPMPCA